MRDLVRTFALFGLIGVAACGDREAPVEPAISDPIAAPPPTTAPKPMPSHSSAPAPKFEDAEEVDALCQQFSGLSLPPGDQPSPTERRALAKCDAEKLYYGIGVRPDYAAARKCAYAQLERGESPMFEGADMLMMLYANGRGVPTNFDLALKFACTREANRVERGFAVATIWKARAGAGLTQVLDVCDFEGTTNGHGSCVSRDSRIAGAKREARKAKVTMGLKSRELTFLEKAAKDFFEARVENEVDTSGTGRAVFMIEEADRLADEYVNLLEQLIDPTFSPNGPVEAEARLAAVHAQRLGCKELRTAWARQAGISQRGLATTQRLWTTYRNAWLALVAKVRSKAQVPAWRLFFAEQRLRMFDSLQLCQKK